jgi:septal ring factor EnvC (AmiA/AmiB activator)
VNPDLVARDEQGKPYSVRYEAVNAMLLNEFLKAHRKIEEQVRTNRQQEATITELKSAVAQQQDEIQTLMASLKEQAAQIQKVNDQLTLTEPAPQVVLSNH